MSGKKNVEFVRQNDKDLAYAQALESVVDQRQYFEENGLMDQLKQEVKILTESVNGKPKEIRPPAHFVELVAQDRVFRKSIDSNLTTTVPGSVDWWYRKDMIEVTHQLFENDSDGNNVFHSMNSPSFFKTAEDIMQPLTALKDYGKVLLFGADKPPLSKTIDDITKPFQVVEGWINRLTYSPLK